MESTKKLVSTWSAKERIPDRIDKGCVWMAWSSPWSERLIQLCVISSCLKKRGLQGSLFRAVQRQAVNHWCRASKHGWSFIGVWSRSRKDPGFWPPILFLLLVVSIFSKVKMIWLCRSSGISNLKSSCGQNRILSLCNLLQRSDVMPQVGAIDQAFSLCVLNLFWVPLPTVLFASIWGMPLTGMPYLRDRQHRERWIVRPDWVPEIHPWAQPLVSG